MKHADVKTVSRWLRHKENPHIRVNVAFENQVADNNVQAAAHIHRHWQLLWQQLEPLDEQAVATRMAATFNQDRPSVGNFQWTPPDLRTFTNAMLDSKGAAGCDSWSSVETKYLPVAAIQHLHLLTLRWHQKQQLPGNFVFSRQVNLPKPHKIKDGLLSAEHTRAITVFSIFYRAWAIVLGLERFSLGLSLHRSLTSSQGSTIMKAVKKLLPSSSKSSSCPKELASALITHSVMTGCASLSQLRTWLRSDGLRRLSKLFNRSGLS